MEVERERAESVAAGALTARGLSARDARTTAAVLVAADACGKHSHGLLRLSRIVRGLEAGNVDPEGEIRVVAERGGAATVDGGARPGPAVALEAVAEATARAETHGVGAVGVRNANHLGMLGYYTDRARREGQVCLAMTNTEPAMPPHGGAAAVLGTNPIAVGLPTDPPFNLDMSTSAISRGAVLRADRQGESLPEGVALDAAGEPTTDPAAALAGVVRPFGGPKGSGLAIVVELLAGALVGAATGTDVTGTYHTEEPCTKGDLFVALDPVAFGAERFAADAGEFLSELKRTERAAGVGEIRLPGERSVEAMRAADTVAVDEEVWEDVAALSD
jgi:L-2-hydroxycarboxylate dehydrogenase (NAD+)